MYESNLPEWKGKMKKSICSFFFFFLNARFYVGQREKPTPAKPMLLTNAVGYTQRPLRTLYSHKER